MTPADVSAVLAAAAGADAAPVSVRGPGVYASPVALRAGVDPEVVAARVRRAEGVEDVSVVRGLVVVRVDAGALAGEIVRLGDVYGRARVRAGTGWSEWPRTFDNPGFCVRYAYARAGWVQRWARELGVTAGEPEGYAGDELRLLEVLAEMPGRGEQAERENEPRVLASYLERLAGVYHDVHERCPALPSGDEKPGAVHAARVTLAAAARIALGNGLDMIGETPRELI
ncbi:DALR anticodon-binding domain-containing protein [Actinomadura parmotrematis]|uniref:Anticodon-binding protein n=1 Tax=Actinomadura parmotrematis TaxID=2864039 RepID=A0ABS7FWH1_9ACTN|nr:DALR anticodon-binding domain-containing protein [Actinomadura parmotrematis]MBW8483927.1 anticodon-binding protein [Actinomadura parmotrematis]